MPDAAVLLEEALWDALRHPRGRGGQWRDAFRDAPEIAGKLEQQAKARELALPAIERSGRPLEQTEAYRRGMRRLDYTREHGPHGDEFLYDLATDYGCTGRPHQVDEPTLRKLIEEKGATELWRGVSDEDYAKLFVEGTYYAGYGFRGNGIYAAAGPEAHDRAVAYAQSPPARGIATKSDRPVVMHLALHPGAKTITLAEANDQAQAAAREAQAAAVSVKRDPTSQAGTPGAVRLAVATDPSKLAIVNGYDAIVVSEKEVIILNRSALIASGEFELAGENVTHRIRRVGND